MKMIGFVMKEICFDVEIEAGEFYNESSETETT